MHYLKVDVCEVPVALERGDTSFCESRAPARRKPRFRGPHSGAQDEFDGRDGIAWYWMVLVLDGIGW